MSRKIFSNELTRISTLLDALSPVGDPFCCVARINDVAFVSRWTMQRLISILSSAAGLSWKISPQVINVDCTNLENQTVTWWCPSLAPHSQLSQGASQTLNIYREVGREWL